MKVRIAVSLACVVAAVPRSAVAAEPTQIAPESKTGKQRRADRRARDWSEAGTRNGTFEIVLGSVAAAVTAVVIGRGIWELTQIDEHRQNCDNGAGDLDCGSAAEGQGNRIAAGLSFGFAVPLSVATGFLFARGVRTRRDHRAWHQAHPSVTLTPSVGRRGGGLALQLRF